jgi:rod shape determining protein RodA
MIGSRFDAGPFPRGFLSRLIDSRTLSRLDLNLIGVTILLAAIGCASVYSATYAGTNSELFQRQVVWVVLGIAVMTFLVFVDYRALLEISPILYAIGIVLLLYLLIWGRATTSVRWIYLFGFQFQPSEFVKIFTALFLARFFGDNQSSYLTLRSFLLVGVIIGVPVALIAVQPDFGTAASFVPVVAAAMYFGGIRPRYWIVAILLALALSGGLWHSFLKPYQKERIMTYLDPGRDPLGSGYQVIQSKIAIGSGGLTGKGFKEGTQTKLEYLPARHTDFILAVIGEEWGFVGVSVVLSLYLAVILATFRIARTARDRSGTYLAICLISYFVFHIVVNVAMQIGLLPITGIPLPLVSYGGSSTLMFFASIGLILNVDYRKFVNVD